MKKTTTRTPADVLQALKHAMDEHPKYSSQRANLMRKIRTVNRELNVEKAEVAIGRGEFEPYVAILQTAGWKFT